MADENISIEIADKVSPSISNKLLKIAENARNADNAVQRLKTQLASLNTSALSQIQSAANSATQAINQSAIAAQRLATEQQRTAGAAAQAAAAQTRATTAQTQGQTAAQQLATATARTATEQQRSATAAQKLATEQQRTAAAQSQAQAAADRAALAALRLQQAQDRAAQSSRNAASSIMSFVRGAAALVGVGLSANAILSAADAYTVLQNKLQNVSESEAQVNELTNRLFETANRTRTPVQETAQAFTRFDMALKNLGKSQDDSLRLTETVNKMLVVSGATSNEAGSALLQLSQAFNKGKLDGDEFRSVMELMPNAADAIAKRLKVTRGELLKLAPEGKITAKVMLEAFQDAAAGIDAKFGKTVPTLSQAMTVLRNNATQTFGEINKQLGITAGLSKAIIFLGENMKTVALIAAVLGAALLVAFGPALVGMLSAATSAVWAFTVALAANPIGLLVVGITAAIAALALFGDEIKVSEDGLVTLKDTALAVWSFIADGAGVAWSYIKEGWNAAIDFISAKTDGWGEKFRDVGSFVLNFAKTVVNGYIGLWVGAYNAVVGGWQLFPAAMKDIFAMALNSVVGITEKIVNAALEGINKITSLANQGAEKLGIGKIFDSDLGVSLDKYKMEVTGAASDLAGTVKTAFSSAFNTDFIGNAVGAIDKRAREISAARRAAEGAQTGNLRGTGTPGKEGPDAEALKAAQKRADEMAKVNRALDEELTALQRLGPEYAVSNRLLEIENNLLDKKIKLTDSERESIRKKLQAIQDQKAANALADINKELDQQSQILAKLGPQQEIEQQMLQYRNDFYSKGLVLTQQQTEALQKRLETLQQERAVSQELNKIYAETEGKKISLQQQTEALNQAYQRGLINLDAYSNRLVKIGLDMTNLKLQMGEGTFNDVMVSSLGSIVSQYEGVMSGLSSAFGDFFTSFTDGFANSVGRAIVYSENLGDALNSVAKEALAGLISALVKLGIQWVVNAALGQSLGAAALASQTAMSTAAAAATAAAWAPAAAMVSLASFGANSAPAMAGISATTALSEGLALASMAGFEMGGYTGNVGTKEIAGLVHGREFVFDAASTQRIGVNNLEAIRNGASYVASNSSSAGSGSSGAAVSVNIENYGTSKDFEVQQISETDIRIIARDEARNMVQKEAPGVVAAQIRNPNSSVSKSLNQNTKTERRR
jgi:tape measure domain-containing protein